MRVRTSPARVLPETLDPSAWDTLTRLRADGQLWDFFEPSPRVPVSPAVRAFADACGIGRASDPLTCFHRIVSAVHGALVYAPESTTVDTPHRRPSSKRAVASVRTSRTSLSRSRARTASRAGT